MIVQSLMFLTKTAHGLKVQVRWHSLPETEDSLEPNTQKYRMYPNFM